MAENLLKTPLYDLHVEQGAKLVPFAGYEMPVQYSAGILKEHVHTRTAAGLFDVSHMGQVVIRGERCAEALESLVPVDVVDLPSSRQRYAFFTNDAGGILDDLMITNADDHLFLVVNAACKHQDLEHMQGAMPGCEVSMLDDKALLALQGPLADEVMSRHSPKVHELAFMDSLHTHIAGVECRISRSGYTGEDGFEIALQADEAQAFARRLLNEPEVELIGLGARDSLRLEAGLCLYGHDLDTGTTPVEAGLRWAISPARRADGVRSGGFPGAERILAELADGPARRRVGIRPQGRAPVREGAALVDADARAVGQVTSGGFGPSVGAPVAMGYVSTDCTAAGTALQAEVRGKRLDVEVAKLPFAPHRYRRG